MVTLDIIEKVNPASLLVAFYRVRVQNSLREKLNYLAKAQS